MENKSKITQQHWDNAYTANQQEKLGWYETDLSPMLAMISRSKIKKTSKILIAGAGTSTLVDELLQLGYTNIIVTDISPVSIQKLQDRIGNKVTYVLDDLTAPRDLQAITNVDLWIDRAVLHFFLQEVDQHTYFDLIRGCLSPEGQTIFAEFAMDGATKCCGLDIRQYSRDRLQSLLGNQFHLVSERPYLFKNPSGGERPYIYALFSKKNV